MSRFDKRVVVAGAILLASLLQGGLAGVAYFGRKTSEGILQAEQGLTSRLAAEIATARQRQAESPAPPPSQWSLLENPDVSGILELIQARGDAAGIVFSNLKAAQSSTAGKQSFQIAGYGTPDQLCHFVADIEKQERLILVESGKVVPGTESEIRFELGMATYHLGGPQ